MPHASTPTPRCPAPQRLALAGSLALLTLAGCSEDLVGGGEPVILSFTEEVQFEFTSEAAMMMGQTTEIPASDRIDLAEEMRRQGFGKAEVLSATVESARLQVQFPLGVNADFLNAATLQIEAAEQPGATVATQTDFPSAREATLDVRAGENVIGYVTAPDFGLVLEVDPAELQNEEDYQLQLTIQFRVEFEGV